MESVYSNNQPASQSFWQKFLKHLGKCEQTRKKCQTKKSEQPAASREHLM